MEEVCSRKSGQRDFGLKNFFTEKVENARKEAGECTWGDLKTFIEKVEIGIIVKFNENRTEGLNISGRERFQGFKMVVRPGTENSEDIEGILECCIDEGLCIRQEFEVNDTVFECEMLPTAKYAVVLYAKSTENVQEKLLLKTMFDRLESDMCGADGKEALFVDTYFRLLHDGYNIPEKDFLCRLSNMQYEKRENKGILCIEKSVSGKMDIEWIKICEGKNRQKSGNEAEDITQKKQEQSIQELRKMLEFSKKNYDEDMSKCIVCDTEMRIKGIVQEKKVREGNLLVYFDGGGKWRAIYNGTELVRYDAGKLFIGQCIQQHDYEKELPDGIENKELFVAMMECLNSQQHGALLIIAEDAASEVERLCEVCNRGTEIEPFAFNEDNLTFLSGLCSVDGAIFVDYSGKCYGYGVILDGEAKIRGVRERGSRFNSAANYVSGTGRYAVVVSEDKEKGLEIISPNKYELVRLK